MTSITYSYINVVIAVLLFIISSWQLIIHTDKNGKDKVPPIGWAALIASVIFGVFSWLEISASNSEKVYEKYLSDSTQRARDSIHVLERREDSSNTVIAINNALQKYNLQYRPNNRDVVVSKIRNQNIGDNYGIVGNNGTIVNQKIDFATRSFVAEQNQTDFLLPDDAPLSADRYIVIRNGVNLYDESFTVQKGKLVLKHGIDKDDRVVIKWTK